MANIRKFGDLDIDTEFLNTLSVKQHNLLRSLVRRIHMHYYPADLYSDHMADMLISKFGPEYCERLLKKAIDAGLDK